MWTRVGWAAGCFAAIMGFSRLAYGVLVPPMRDALGGNFALYGEIGGANMIGYLAGSLLTTRLARRADRARINAFALLGMSLTMGACGLVAEPISLGVLRTLVGFASGIALALTLALGVENVPPARRGVAAAVVWGGGCIGIALAGGASGFARDSASAWRFEWYAMGVVGVLVALAFARVTAGRFAAAERVDDGSPIGIFDRDRYLALAISYFAFGFGYIEVVTFFGASLVRAHGMPLGAAWTLLGLSGIAGVALWGPLVDKLRSGLPVALACACCACGAGLVAMATAASALAGAIAIGVSFIGIPAMIGALLQQREPPARYPRAFASITVLLGIGQIIGPVVGGAIADRYGTSAAVASGAVALGISALCAFFYRRPGEDARALAAA